MSEREVCPLGPDWRLAADELQWIVEHGYPRRDGGVKWNGVAFVTSTKAILLRVLREKGALIDTKGGAALAALPDSFRAWHEANSALHSGGIPLGSDGLPLPLEQRRAMKFHSLGMGTNG